MSQTMALPHFDLPRARRALKALLRDPDDLPQVFTLIDAISGTAPHRLLRGLRRTATGQRLLRDRPDIVRYLSDRVWLRALPEGSLGRAYLDFVESEGISAEGIRSASLEGTARGQRDDFMYLHQRMRDTHDLWHAVTGYKGDVLGEVSLLAFTLGQHWNTGVAVIIVAALLKGWDRGMSAMVRDGFRRGRAAAWLPSQDWESLLAVPLETVRTQLRVGAPRIYREVRTADLRAQRAL